MPLTYRMTHPTTRGANGHEILSTWQSFIMIPAITQKFNQHTERARIFNRINTKGSFQLDNPFIEGKSYSLKSCFNLAVLEGFQEGSSYLWQCHAITIRFEFRF